MKLKRFSADNSNTYLLAYLLDNGKYHFERYNSKELALDSIDPDDVAPNFRYVVPINKANELKDRLLDLGADDFMSNPKKWKEFSNWINKIGAKSFSEREQVPQYIADEVDASGVVVKYKGDWRIVSKSTTPYEFWDAKYKTKQDAEDALSAYHANKRFSGGEYLIGYRKSDPSKKVMAYPSKVSTEFIKVGNKTYPSHKSATEDAKRYNITEDTWIEVLGEAPKYYVVGDSGYASYKIYEDTKKLLKLIRSNGEVPSTTELDNKISEIIDSDGYWRNHKDMGTKYLKERLDRSLPKFREYII